MNHKVWSNMETNPKISPNKIVEDILRFNCNDIWK